MSKKKKETAIVVESGSLALFAFNETELIETAVEAEDIHADLAELDCDGPETVTLFAEAKRQWRDTFDRFEALRKQAVAPLNAKKAELQETFKAVQDPIQKILELCSSKIGAYEKQRIETEQAADLAATKALEAGDTDAALYALAVAGDAAAVKVQGVSVAKRWFIKRIAEDLLPDEYWTPDVQRLAQICKATPSGAEPPPIPGVVYDWEPVTTVRR